MELEELFTEVFKEKAQAMYAAPARINLIGEHIDYNGGKVLPCAISCFITGCVSKRNDDLIVTYSTNYSNQYSISLDDINYQKSNNWANYVFGVFKILKQEGYVVKNGLNILIDSQIPLGSGLSSSAALLDLVLFIVNDQFNLNLDLKTIAHLAQKTENEFCGLKCGIMDQAAIALGKKDKAILLDCNKFEYEYEDIDLGDYSFVVLKTNTPRSLVESKYNVRVEECQAALNVLKNVYRVNNLSELKASNLNEIKSLLNNDVIYRRTKHVVTENDRVMRFINALKKKDIQMLGQILVESHQSLKNDYEVTGIHLDTIVDAAINAGAIGARMTGAGFGGCAIALIKTSEYNFFKEKVDYFYFNKFQIHPDIFRVDIVDGPKRIIK